MYDATHSDLAAMPALETRVVGTEIHYFAETDSTNNRALESDTDGAVFLAEAQYAGRGRQGKRWHSAPGLGLWFSVSLDGPLPGVSFAAALAVRDAVAGDVDLAVKWPNDLYHGKRKVCGLLVEQRRRRIALGVGLNVNHQLSDFPAALRHRTGSLAVAINRHWDRAQLFWRLLHFLDDAVARLRRGETDRLRETWVDACGIVGRRVRRGAVEGVVRAVDNDGALLVQTRSGLKRVTCGDISAPGYYL